MAERAFATDHVLGDTPLHQGALRIGKCVEHVLSGPYERPLIAGLFLAFESPLGFRGRGFWIILFYEAPSTIMRTNRRLYP